MGAECSQTALRMILTSMLCIRFDHKLRCVSITPLGPPVVPLV